MTDKISAPPPPQAARKKSTDTHHAITRTDEYAWLRDENWQAVMRDPAALRADIHAHIEAENQHTEAVLSQTGDLRQTLFAEMKARLKEDDATPPRPKGAWAWFVKYEKGGAYPQFCRQSRDGKNPKIILDGNQRAKGEAYFKIADTAIAPDQNLFAWAVDIKGSEYFTLKITQTDTGADLPDTIPNTSGQMAWSADGQHIFYILLDENHRPSRVMRHQLGTPPQKDTEIYHEKDAGFFVSLSASRSGDFIFIQIHDHETSETRLIDAHAPHTAPRLVAPRRTGLEYQLSHDAARNRFIILTNHEAEDFKLMAAPIDAPENWHALIAHKHGTLILDMAAYANHLAWLTRENARPTLHIQCLKTNKTHRIAFDEEAYDLSLDAGLEYDTPILRFTYSSMTTPPQTYDYDMNHATRQLVHEEIVPNHQPKNYITKRFWARGADGARIPVSLLYHKDTPHPAPLLLYGYGAYGITIAPSFSRSRLSLVDRGFIYAIAHIRGGKAMGHHWFLQGRGKHKQNSFNDFIATARALIAAKLTRQKHITIHGGSAGGLLVGASLNLAPELFCGAVAEVPFVDVLTTMLDDTLPLTPPEWPEWGNPIASANDYQTIAAYAPYDNIRAVAYPHILATGGLTDPRVTYWEPTKWVARLRDRRTDNGLTLLNMEMAAGHGGKAGRYNRLHETAFIYAFILLIHGQNGKMETLPCP